MNDVFISYSHRDTDLVQQLVDALNVHKRAVWVDRRGIDYATQWNDEIYHGIESADNFVLVISPDSLNSQYCHDEIDHARKQSKRIVPLLIKSIDEKELIGGWYTNKAFEQYAALAHENWKAVKKIQFIDFTALADVGKTIEAVLATLAVDPERVSLHTQLLERVRDWQTRGKNPSALLRGDELVAYEQWRDASLAQGDDPRPTDEQIAYIQTSRQAEDLDKATDARREQRIRTFRLAAIALTVVGIVAVLAAAGSTLFASRQIAQAGATLTPIPPTLTSVSNLITSQQTAGLVNSLVQARTEDKIPAILLGIRALKIAYSPQAVEALNNALESNHEINWFVGHTGPVNSVAFSPDGRYVLTGGSDHTARLWDVTTGQTVRIFSGHSNSVTTVAFTPDGRYVLTDTSDAKFKLWDIATGQAVPGSADIHAGLASNDAAFSPDGRTILTGGDSGTAHLLDTKSGNVLREFGSQDDQDPVNVVTFGSDGQTVLSADAYGTATLWNVATGQQLTAFEKDNSESGLAGVNAVALSPDGAFALTGNRDRTAILWDTKTGKALHTFSGHSDSVSSVAFSPDGSAILTGSADGTAILWDTNTYQALQIFSGSADEVNSVAFSPDGRYVLTGSSDGTARLWATDSSTLGSTTKQPASEIGSHRNYSSYPNTPVSLAVSPNGRYLAAGGFDRSAEVGFSGTTVRWDMTTGQNLRTYAVGDDVSSIAFSPDSRYLAIGYFNAFASVQVFDVATGESVRTLPVTGFTNSLVFSADGRYVLAGGGNTIATLWNLATGDLVRTFSGHTEAVTSVAISSDTHYILTGSADKTARLWDVTTGATLRSFEGQIGPVHGVAFSPDGHYILTGSNDQTARLWETTTGVLVRSFVGHRGQINSVAISPDGRTIVTASDDKTAQLWDLNTGNPIQTFIGHSDMVNAAAFTPDGRYVVTASLDHTLRLWNTDNRDFVAYACSQVWRDFTPQERAKFGLPGSDATCPPIGSADQGMVFNAPPAARSNSVLPLETAIAPPTITLTPFPTVETSTDGAGFVPSGPSNPVPAAGSDNDTPAPSPTDTATATIEMPGVNTNSTLIPSFTASPGPSPTEGQFLTETPTATDTGMPTPNGPTATLAITPLPLPDWTPLASLTPTGTPTTEAGG